MTTVERQDYRQGFIAQEAEIAAAALPVRGALPPWLAGTLVRNGPAVWQAGTERYRHWFDGLAMLHAFAFAGGAVSYTSRFIDSPARRAARAGEIRYPEFGTDPCRALFGRVMTLFQPRATGDNTNVNITRLAGQMIAMTETPAPISVDPETLATVGRFDYDDRLPGDVTTAHPHYDAGRREALNYTTHLGASSSYHLYRLPAGSRARRQIGAIPVKQPGYMHSFAMTEHYLVLAEYPLFINPIRLLLGGQTFAEHLEWKPERAARFLIVRRDDGALVTTLEAETFFAFHHVNAYEADGGIVLDIAAYPDAGIIGQLYLDRLMRPGGAPQLAELRRYHLPLAGQTAHYEVLSDEAVELPRIHYERHNARPYRLVYGVSTARTTPDDFQNQLVRVDVERREARLWREPGCYPGEPVFVASPGAEAEDDGLILSVVLDATAGRSFLLVLDARLFVEIARAEVPHAIPFGFHGQFFGR